MADAIDIADALVSYINGGTFNPTFTAVRSYAPEQELKDTKTLRVDVVPQSETEDIASRSATQEDYLFTIVVRQKVANLNNATLDTLMALVQSIKDRLRFSALDSVGARWIRTERTAPYLPDHLLQLMQFTAVLTVTYRLIR